VLERGYAAADPAVCNFYKVQVGSQVALIKTSRDRPWHNRAVSNVTPIKTATSSLRILVVDDHLDGLHSLVHVLKVEGHVVTFAINGFSALSTAREFKPNVIILDMRLPDMTGLDVARQLKFEPGMEGVRIIGLSGSAEFRQKAAEEGLEFVLKPVEPKVWRELLGAGSPQQSSGSNPA
jgi:CheY-like chemotaxis protein